MNITIKNPDISGNIKTNLSADYSSGTTLTVDSSSSFVNGNYIVVGEPYLERTEVTNLSATPPSKTTMTIGALSFTHTRGTPVYYTRWDKYSLEYRTSSTGSWTAYGSMPASLAYDSTHTEYRDTAATTTYQWRYRYYSTESATYSDYSDTITASGWPKNSVGYMVRQVRKIINDPEGKTVNDAEIIRFLNAAQDKVYSLYDRWWFLFKVGTAIDTVASTKTYNLPSDFGRMHSVLFKYVNGNTDTTYNLKYLSMVEFDYESRDNNESDSDEIKYYTIYPGDSTNETGYLYIWPTPETAGLDITPRYYHTITDLDSYADETSIPIPEMLEDYAISQIYQIRKEDAKADRYDSQFREQIELLKMQQRKQVGSPRYLWKYKGQKAESRYFGSRVIDTDDIKEKFW